MTKSFRMLPALLLAFTFCGGVFAQDVDEESEPEAQSEAPESPQTRCLTLVYNRYITRGFNARTSWNNAVRDCASGMDLSCVETAYRHYASLGYNDNQSYYNALRDCRAPMPNYGY